MSKEPQLRKGWLQARGESESEFSLVAAITKQEESATHATNDEVINQEIESRLKSIGQRTSLVDEAKKSRQTD